MSCSGCFLNDPGAHRLLTVCTRNYQRPAGAEVEWRCAGRPFSYAGGFGICIDQSPFLAFESNGESAPEFEYCTADCARGCTWSPGGTQSWSDWRGDGILGGHDFAECTYGCLGETWDGDHDTELFRRDKASLDRRS